MKHRTAIALLIAAPLVFTSSAGFAQGKGRDRPKMDRQQQVDRDRTFDRDRMQDRDRLDQPSRDRDRDQDRTHAPDFARLADGEIYGHEVMSAQERSQYREQLRNAQSDEAREQLRAQHQAEVQSRAQAQGLTLTPTSEGPIYGGNLMSIQERNQYREQLRVVGSEQERAQFMAQHREQIQTRAKAQGVVLEEPKEIEEAE